MPAPPLVVYETAEQYRSHFERTYCRGSITTFDGIEVRFRKRHFGHCFFESSGRDRIKDTFSRRRAERIDWIAATLRDPDAELYVGWNRDKRRYHPGRRVAILSGEFVVVIALTGEQAADFVTAYVLDSVRPGLLSTLQMIRRGPRWHKKNR